jgi:glutathione S-transferase
MTATESVVVFHSPQSRSTGVLHLLEELDAPYEVRLVNLRGGEQLEAPYRAVNPMGKVPAIEHRGSIVTEQVAIYIYLADEFQKAGLAPAIGDKLRGPYLRWLAFYGSCFEPGVVDRSQKRAPAPRAMSPYADFDTMYGTLVDALGKGPYLLGERFSAADVLWGTALTWITAFKLVPETPVVQSYVTAWNARGSVARVAAKDAEFTGKAG